MRYVFKNTKSVASINPGKKIVSIDQSFYQIPNYNIRVFILLHELAHLKTINEKEADKLALSFYYALGYPLRDVIFALSRYQDKFDRIQGIFNECYKLVNQGLV